MFQNRSPWGVIGLILVLLTLSSFAFAGEGKEWYDVDETPESFLMDLRTPNQFSTFGNGYVFPKPQLDVLRTFAPDLGPDWDDLRKLIVQGLVNTKLGKINFDFDKDNLDADAQKTVLELAGLLQTRQDIGLHLFGHTDLLGSDEYNMDLSFRRAEHVRLALIAAGVDGSRLTAAHFGKRQPLINLFRKERENRRVEAQVFDLLEAQRLR